MWAVVITIIWQAAGYLMVMDIAGIDRIPIELYESATLDGAGALRKFGIYFNCRNDGGRAGPVNDCAAPVYVYPGFPEFQLRVCHVDRRSCAADLICYISDFK